MFHISCATHGTLRIFVSSGGLCYTPVVIFPKAGEIPPKNLSLSPSPFGSYFESESSPSGRSPSLPTFPPSWMAVVGYFFPWLPHPWSVLEEEERGGIFLTWHPLITISCAPRRLPANDPPHRHRASPGRLPSSLLYNNSTGRRVRCSVSSLRGMRGGGGVHLHSRHLDSRCPSNERPDDLNLRSSYSSGKNIARENLHRKAEIIRSKLLSLFLPREKAKQQLATGSSSL